MSRQQSAKVQKEWEEIQTVAYRLTKHYIVGGKIVHLFFHYITFEATSFASPMQTLHFSAEQLPILKPPISWDAKLSPETKLMVPLKDFLSPFVVNWYPPSSGNKYRSTKKKDVDR